VAAQLRHGATLTAAASRRKPPLLPHLGTTFLLVDPHGSSFSLPADRWRAGPPLVLYGASI